MTDHATPNLPSRDLETTARFYAALGFEESYRDEGWMILERGGLTLEFFLAPDIDPARSAHSCCLRLDDVNSFFEVVVAAKIPVIAHGWPRAHEPRREPWGGLVGALIDIDGSLLRLVQEEVASPVA